MRTNLILAVALAFAASGCEKGRTPQERADLTPQPMTFVGCVEQGASSDEFVVKGRSVLQHVEAVTGSAPGGVPSTETLPGGDADRNPSTGGTREDWGDRISPKLVSTSGQDFRTDLGRRVVVTGQFVPASMAQPVDQLTVQHIEPIADTCEMQ